MEANNIVQFLEGKTIFITGSTGFLAKIFVEKILRVQPNVKKLYLLIRATDSKSALQRFNSEIIAKDLFRVLKEKCGPNLNTFTAQKITVVAGDITRENLGVQDLHLLEEMWREINVVINVAATTNFDERYDVSIGINTMGAKHVLNFAKRCARLNLLLHVSTAYVAGDKEGLILETPYAMGETLNGTSGLDIDNEKKIIEKRLKELRAENLPEESITLAMKDLGIQRARKFGWPNTYVFTKAMAEMLLGNLRGSIPLVIVRPTIITSTYKEPFPGWVEGTRTIDSLAVGYAKGKITCFLGDPKTIVDVIPADMVVNAMIVAMVAHANQHSEETIYHVGSSLSNPLQYSCLQDYGVRYFTKHPWVDKEGNPVKVGAVTVLETMDSFHKYIALYYLLPLKGLKIVNAALCQYFRDLYEYYCRKIKFVMRMVDLYGPYLFFKGVFDDMNAEKLRRAAAREKGFECVFYFDPKSVNWEDYFMNIHIPGAVKYVFK